MDDPIGALAGRRLETLRRLHDFSTDALAQKAGCARQTLYKRRGGEGWTTAEMARFGDVFSAPAEVFVMDEPEFWQWWQTAPKRDEDPRA